MYQLKRPSDHSSGLENATLFCCQRLVPSHPGCSKIRIFIYLQDWLCAQTNAINWKWTIHILIALIIEQKKNTCMISSCSTVKFGFCSALWTCLLNTKTANRLLLWTTWWFNFEKTGRLLLNQKLEQENKKKKDSDQKQSLSWLQG